MVAAWGTRRDGAEGRPGRRSRWSRRGRSRAPLAALALVSALFAPAASADPPRVVAVRSTDLKLYDEVIAGFREALGTRVDVVTLPGGEAEVRRFVEGLNRLPPSLVLTLGAEATSLIHREAPDVPLVYARVLSTVESGRSGDNLTGVRQVVPAEAQLKLLLRLAPRIHRIGVVYDPDRSARWLADVERAGRGAGVEMVRAAESDKSNAAEALSRVTSGADAVDALWVAPDRTWMSPETVPLLLRTAREKKVPLLTYVAELVEDGALAAAYVDDRALGGTAAGLARRILNGEPAAEVAVADPPVSVAINAAVAEQLGLTVPAELLAAARVIR